MARIGIKVLNRLFGAVGALLLGACFQITNSVSNDPVVYGDQTPAQPDDTAENRFLAAKAIIRTNCGACHPTLIQPEEVDYTTHKTGSGYTFAVPGNLQSSGVYRILKGSGIDERMPPEGRLSQPDLETIENWITKMAVPATLESSGESPSDPVQGAWQE